MVEAYRRRRSGLAGPTAGKRLSQRILRSKWTWLGLGLVVTFVVSWWLFFRYIQQDTPMPDGTSVPGLNADALWLSAGKAAPTMFFWVACFVLIDRFRPQRLLTWFLALGWGACLAVIGSYFINTWAGEQMAVVDQVPGLASARVAIFVAPFVEESMKACVVFLIATADRLRFTSRVSGAVIGGLAGAGFAFTENIIYYARVLVYGSYSAGTGDVMAALDYLVYLRGVVTCFGHPLFTMMTGLGVAFAVTSRSKVVRVVAPAAGYLLAALLHMVFNLFASILDEQTMMRVAFIGVWPAVIMVFFSLIVSLMRQGRTVAARLGDYVAMGWLPPEYPESFQRLRTRLWTIIISCWHGNVVKTWKLQVRATRLALLREAITRGTVDQAGWYVERELLDEIAELAASGGLVNGRGLRPYWPWKHWRNRRAARSTVGANSLVNPPLSYSVVDSRWGPPA